MNAPPLMETKQRIESLDILRGFIILLMALDHTRDFFHTDAFRFDPEDISQSTIPLFFTRWITHLCAPLFLLIAGISIKLYQEKNTPQNTSYYLLKRGAWLIVLELTLVQFAWHFSVDFHHVTGLVLWMLGWCMMFMALFIHCSQRLIIFFSLTILLLHNTLDGLTIPENNLVQKLAWAFLHVNDKIFLTDTFYVRILYPLIPALAIMMLGYGIGKWYTSGYDALKRKKQLLYAGLVLFTLFLLFRYFNVYGDVLLFEKQPTVSQTIMSFLSISKYPFSLHYCLSTLGIGLVLLYFFETIRLHQFQILHVFGKESLFIYILHLYFFHTLAGILFIVSNGGNIPKALDPGTLNNLGYGYSLSIVYLIWILGCTVFYFAALKYAAYKKTHYNVITALV